MKPTTIYWGGFWMLSMVATVGLAAEPTLVVSTDAPRQKIISFADLDLTRPEGAATLYKRIRGAARDVCHPLEDRSLQHAALMRECLSTAIGNAVADVNSPLLTQQHFAATGQAQPQDSLAVKR